jgi:hypothetical protein
MLLETPLQIAMNRSGSELSELADPKELGETPI